MLASATTTVALLFAPAPLHYNSRAAVFANGNSYKKPSAWSAGDEGEPPSSGSVASNVAKETELLAELLDGIASSDTGKERMLGRIQRRMRRRKDAERLLELEDMLEEERGPLLLQREVTLFSTVSELWDALGGAFESKEPTAQATDALEGAAERLDQAWRRDALRALIAVQRAPEKMQAEVRRQRLLKLQPELKILGLHRRRLEALTESDVRTARTTRARDLHPDLRRSREAQRGGFGLGGLFGGSRDADEDLIVAQDDDGKMTELNAAYDKVKHAVTAPITALG